MEKDKKNMKGDKIIRCLVYNDGVETDHREATKHEQKVCTTWCKSSDVEKLESAMQSAQEEIERLRHEVSENKWLIANQKVEIEQLKKAIEEIGNILYCDIDGMGDVKEALKIINRIDNWEAKG